MIIWMVARYSARNGLFATAHLDESAAMAYVRYTYSVPNDIADTDVVTWSQDASGDQIWIDYDDACQEPR